VFDILNRGAFDLKVKELIAELQKVNGESRVFMGYDGNMVVTEPESVELITEENQIGECWYRVKPGDTVILCDN
jgi:hypothetical protein